MRPPGHTSRPSKVVTFETIQLEVEFLSSRRLKVKAIVAMWLSKACEDYQRTFEYEQGESKIYKQSKNIFF